MVVDLQSETGTFINDQRISKSIAGEYDSIKVGSHVFQLQAMGEQAKSTLPQAEEKAFEKQEPTINATKNESSQLKNISSNGQAKGGRNGKEKIVV